MTAPTLPAAPPVVDLERAWSSKRGIPGFFSAVNHKQIGLRFIWTGVAFLLVGGIEGLLIRIQLARAENTFLGPEAYNQIFTMHGTTMMFLFAVPLLEGLAMYLVPLQVGTRDLPFPRLNAFGYWTYLAGGILLNWSLLTGSVPDGGWFAYVPLTGLEFSPTRALDFWLLGVTLVEIAGIIGAIELVVGILRLRAPGMSLGRMPLFTWSALIMAGMMLIAFPFVVIASLLLELERKFGAPFYDAASGGNPLLWQHLFWIFGHPEVYIMLLPATGVISAVVAAHVGRRIVAYPLVVASLAAIAIVSFGLWVHHMFAVGLPIAVISLFAVASYFIAIPSGIQVFAWIATIWDGRPQWRAPMWFAASSVVIFVLGGVTGVMVATAPWDLQAHDTFFVVAHLHYVLIGGVVFPMLAGLHHWFPKMTGRLPGERASKVACVVMFVGFNVTFFPQHWLGLQGMVRRVYTYHHDLGWDGSNLVSTIGSFALALGFLVFFANLAWAWRRGPVAGPDPWGGDSLEWLAPSPPPSYNFAVLPAVTSGTPLWHGGLDEAPFARAEVAMGEAGARREVLQTSLVDARPERVEYLPGPSYLPVLTATALTVTVVGVLVDWWVLAAAGLAGVLLTAGAWIHDNRRMRDDLPAAPTDGRSTLWWGVLLAVISVGTMTGALVYAYFYLRLGADTWPLGGAEQRAIGWPLVALACVAAALVLAPGVGRGPVQPVGGAAGAAASWVLAATGLGAQWIALSRSDLSISADPYQALVLTLELWTALLLVAGLAYRAAVVLRLDRAGDHAREGEADAVVWTGVTVLWLAVWLVVHLAPRVM